MKKPRKISFLPRKIKWHIQKNKWNSVKIEITSYISFACHRRRQYCTLVYAPIYFHFKLVLAVALLLYIIYTKRYWILNVILDNLIHRSYCLLLKENRSFFCSSCINFNSNCTSWYYNITYIIRDVLHVIKHACNHYDAV